MSKENTIEANLYSYVRNNFNNKIASRKAEAEIFSHGTAKGPYFERGKMYVFLYQTPDEPFYDQMPVILSLGWIDSTHALGLNLHYIDYYNRLKLCKMFIKIFLSQIEKNIEKYYGKFNKQSQLINFTYDSLSDTFIKKLGLQNAVHCYRIDRIKRINCLSYEEWHLGIVHNENHFYGGTISDAQKQTFDAMKKLNKKVRLRKNK
ncbi:MAG: hypothetical protein IKO36_07585 [Bacteroidaceae bacterium]|nr:hypothetical protein [Bacteroidaceae bacterium]